MNVTFLKGKTWFVVHNRFDLFRLELSFLKEK